MRSIRERSTDPGLLVFTSLADGPKHGYAITTDVERFAGVRLGPGTLYGALSRLEDRGRIEALQEQLKSLEAITRRGLDRLRVAEAAT